MFPDAAISCERCHGPSGRHLADPKAGTIVNPAKLEPGARDSICEQCHLMGVTRVLNPGREFRDFQPGQRLENTFTTYHDVLPPDAPPGTFKVISHVEQLALSQCARSSQGRLWCGTCHDPHFPPTQPVEYYRSRCLTCHTTKFPAAHPGTDSNCIGCHMPRRDAQDGGHSAFTDHRIQRRPQQSPPGGSPPGGEIAPWREPAPDLQKRSLGIAYISAGLQRRSATSLVQGYRLLTEVQQEFSTDPEVFTSIGTALLIGTQPSEAEFAFERVLSLRPNSAVAETNVAAAHQQAGDIDGTITHLERAVALDPLHLPATTALIDLYRQQGNPAKANDLAEKVRSAQNQHSPSQPQSASTPPKIAEEVFKNLKVLNSIPSDELIPSMRFISSSLGVQCTFCHVADHFDDDSKKPKQTARSMMRMMFAINQTHFDGTREVTCYSCHRGAPRPSDVPALAAENAPGKADTVASPPNQPTPDQIIDNYVRAIGGAAALEKITTRVGTGTMQFDGKSFPVEFFDKTPNKELFIQHTPAGDNISVLNGNSGWIKVPHHPTRDITGSDLDAARADADLQFALHIRETFPELRLEYPEAVEGHEAYVVVGTREGQPSWKFFFDVQSGLLVRLVRYADSPLGLDPTQIDYGDYRAVAGVQIPFTRTIARVGSRSTIQLDAIQQNVPIDDDRFMNRGAQPEKGTPATSAR